MNEHLKINLKKLNDKQQQEVVDYLLDITESDIEKRKKEIELEMMSTHTKEAEELVKNWGKMQGISSGFRSIDELTKGLVGGEITVVAGKTSYGKTLYAINVANEVALRGTPVLFVSLEMSKREITSRFMNINGGNTDDYQNASSMIVFQKNDELDWRSVDELVGGFCEQFTNGMVVIDHLHYFTRELENVAEDLGRITKELKKNAIRHNVPIILISHVRKTSQEANIEDLRGSSYISQDADIVLMVGRDEDYPDKMYIKIEKNRNRGFDFKNNIAVLKLEGIKLSEVFR